MKHKFLIIAAAPIMASCAALPAISAGLSVVQAYAANKHKVVVPATQALIIAHNAYQGAAAAAALAIKTCTITPTVGPCPSVMQNLDKLDEYNNLAKSLLDKADAGQDIAANSAGVMNLVSRMHSLLRN